MAKSTATASRPLPGSVQRIQDHYQQSKKQYQAIAYQEDTEMIDSVQAQVTRLDQEVQKLIDCCNSKKEVIVVEIDDIPRDCEIFAQQVKTNLILGTQILEGHNQMI
jgi:gas vesicle protein